MRWSLIRRFSSLQIKPQGSLQPTTAINDHEETILLYRALLRQCTYLPDPAARKYFWSYIGERFRVYQTKERGPNGRIVRKKVKKIAPAQALKYARKSLKYLQRANDGHMPHLQMVLNMTYGRTGKRGRQIMADYKAENTLDDDAAVLELSRQMSEEPQIRKKAPQLSDQLIALLKSQLKVASSRFDTAPVKTAKPNVPDVNIWGRPFPEIRKPNTIRKWYKMTIARMMPPLPAPEWERLQGLATGAIPWQGPIPRRKLGTTTVTEAIKQPLRFAPENLPYRLTSSTQRVVEKGIHEELRTKPHNLTPRFMRSMWSRVFQKCPRVDWSSEKDKWIVTWGHRGKKGDLVLSPLKKLAPHMFDGVDEYGRLPKNDKASPLEFPTDENGEAGQHDEAFRLDLIAKKLLRLHGR
ncbi:MAG: hypothetical protein Q9170_007678 [Blastenia crenularia]